MTTSENLHRTPNEIYAKLAELFGEQRSSEPGSDTRWVMVGAGNKILIFFPERERPA